MPTTTPHTVLNPPFERFAYVFEGHMALKEFRFQTALKKFVMAYRVNPNCFYDISYVYYKSYMLHKQAETLISLAEFYFACEYYTESIQELEDVFDQDPHLEALYTLLGTIYTKGLEHHRIVKLCEKALNHQIFHQSIVDILSVHYIKTHAYLKNIQLYTTLIKLKPKHAHFYLTLAELHLRNKDSHHVLSCLKNLYKKDKNRYGDILSLLQKLIDAYPRFFEARLFLIDVSMNHFKPHLIEKHSVFLLEKACQNHASSLEEKTPLIQSLSQSLRTACQHYPDQAQLFYLTGRCFFLQDDLEESIHYFEKAHHLGTLKSDLILNILDALITKSPQHLSAYLLKLDILEHENQFEALYPLIDSLLDEQPQLAQDIETRLVKYAKLNPEDHLQIQEHLAKCHFLQESYDQCLTLCDVLLSRSPSVSIETLRILALSHTKQFTQAFEAYHALLTKNKLQKPIVLAKTQLKANFLDHQSTPLKKDSLEKGLLHLAHYKPLEALKHFQSITQEHPDFYTYQACCGRCFVEIGRFDLANDQFNLALQNSSLSGFKEALLYWMCLNYLCLGDLGHAIHHMEHIYKSNMSFQKIDQKLAHYQNQVQLDLRGKAFTLVLLDPMEDTCIPIACQNPENVEQNIVKESFQTMSFAQTHNNEGVRQLLNKHTSTAEASFLLAKQLEPHLAVIKSNLCMSYLSQNNLSQSQKQLETLEKEHESFALMYFIRCLHYLLKNKLKEARDEANQATAFPSLAPIAHLFLGDIAFREKKYEEAKSHWHHAKEEIGLFFLLKRRDLIVSNDMLSLEHWLSDFSLFV